MPPNLTDKDFQNTPPNLTDADFSSNPGDKLNQSQVALAHSQQLIDQYSQQATQAKQNAANQNSPVGIAKNTVSGTANTLLNPLIKAGRSAVTAIGGLFGAQPNYQDTYTDLAGNPQKTLQGEVYSGEKSPLQGAGEFALSASSALPVGKGGQLGAQGLEKVAPMVAQPLERGAQAVADSPLGGALSKITTPIKNYLANRAENKSISALQEQLTPKLDKKEVQLALREGRIAPGRDPSLLRGGTPDEVMPSQATTESAKTIHQNIKGADKMKAPELYSAVDKEVKNMGASLRPVMDTTPITKETVSKITNDWEALKRKQLSDPYHPDTANVEKLQKDFEQNYLEKSKSGNFGNLWDTRIAYDASVPPNVKNATSLSSDTLQSQKEIWLQNRRVLNEAINDSSSGLGEVSSKTFKEMNDMYNSLRSIESKYKPEKEGLPSKAFQFAKEHPFVTGAAGYGVNKAADSAGLPHIPTPF